MIQARNRLEMNLPNALTLSRIVLSPVFMVFLLIEEPRFLYVALALFAVAALTDVYDGHLARRMGALTSFGKFMDPVADKLLVSMALIGFLARDVPGLPGWMVVVIIARELVITGFRSLAAFRGLVITSSRMARVKTVLQMSLVAWILGQMALAGHLGQLWYGETRWGRSPGDLILVGLLWSTVCLTTVSGLDYLLRNRAVLRGALR